MKRGQASIEYMIIIGFVTFAIASVLLLAIFYSSQIKDKIRLNHAENFAAQLINSAESIFFAGEPSRTTVRLYLPEGIKNITIDSDLNYLIITAKTNAGENKRGYESRVPIQGSISAGEGIKKLTIEAKESYVLIS